MKHPGVGAVMGEVQGQHREGVRVVLVARTSGGFGKVVKQVNMGGVEKEFWVVGWEGKLVSWNWGGVVRWLCVGLVWRRCTIPTA